LAELEDLVEYVAEPMAARLDLSVVVEVYH
jgi:hypothetical protein